MQGVHWLPLGMRELKSAATPYQTALSLIDYSWGTPVAEPQDAFDGWGWVGFGVLLACGSLAVAKMHKRLRVKQSSE